MTRREFIKIIGTGVFYLVLSGGCISKLSNIQVKNMQNYSVSIIHSFLDTDNGKEFSISNFPLNCIIKEIRIRSNFTAGQQIWRVAFIDNPNGISPTDTNISCRTAEIFEKGDYIFIGDEIAYISGVDTDNNIITVNRGVKGTIPMYHSKDTRMETANNGIRILLSKDRNYRLDDSLNIYDIMTWKGSLASSIRGNEKRLSLDQIKNIRKYDIMYINDGLNSERMSIIGVNNGETNNSIYIKDHISIHGSGIEIQKQLVYDIPIIYSGVENNMYGILYVDEKISEDVIVDLEIIVA